MNKDDSLRKNNLITKERLNSLLTVDFETGQLVWIDHPQRPDLIGQLAGWINEDYCRVAIDGESLYRANIIWFLYYGYWPIKTVDHKNGNQQDDSIENLRLATKGQNAINSVINARNTSGFKGVSHCSSTNRWRADICIDGRRKNLGRYDSPEEAHKAWATAAFEAFGQEFVRAA